MRNCTRVDVVNMVLEEQAVIEDNTIKGFTRGSPVFALLAYPRSAVSLNARTQRRQ